MKKIITGAALFGVPFLAAAQNLTGFMTFVESLRDIIDALIPLVFAVALLVFFWGVVKYILNAGNPESREQARNLMIGGLIALFVIASVWGLVSFIGDAVGIDQGQSIDQVPGVTDSDAGNSSN